MKLILLLFFVFVVPVMAQTEPSAKLPPIGVEARTEVVVFKAMVDATDDLVIQNGRLKIVHVAGGKPKRIFVNGREWEPEWEKDTSNTFSRFKPPLAPLKGATAGVTLVVGRGEATIVEQPTEENRHRLTVRVRDGGSGAGEVEVKITILPAR